MNFETTAPCGYPMVFFVSVAKGDENPRRGVVHEPQMRREACNPLFKAEGVIQARELGREAARRWAFVMNPE